MACLRHHDAILHPIRPAVVLRRYHDHAVHRFCAPHSLCIDAGSCISIDSAGQPTNHLHRKCQGSSGPGRNVSLPRCHAVRGGLGPRAPESRRQSGHLSLLHSKVCLCPVTHRVPHINTIKAKSIRLRLWGNVLARLGGVRRKCVRVMRRQIPPNFRMVALPSMPELPRS